MARIRTIKPDAFTSDSLCSVPRGTRWTFAGLWTYADDKGRARDDARLIKAALYPLDDDVTLDDVAHDLDALADIGGICRYVVGGKRFLHMPKWHHQKINRPTPAKSPPCPLHEDGGSGHVLEPDDSLSPHGAITEGSTWEKEGKGKGRGRGRGNGVSEVDTADAPRRDDVERICARLESRIEDNGGKRPTATARWRDAARLMLDRDGLTEAEVIGAIDWCQADEFWRANILSLPKLREKYEQLRLQAARNRMDGYSKSDHDAAMFDRQMARAVEQERQMGNQQ